LSNKGYYPVSRLFLQTLHMSHWEYSTLMSLFTHMSFHLLVSLPAHLPPDSVTSSSMFYSCLEAKVIVLVQKFQLPMVNILAFERLIRSFLPFSYVCVLRLAITLVWKIAT
jgi:hypothetical protein